MRRTKERFQTHRASMVAADESGGDAHGRIRWLGAVIAGLAFVVFSRVVALEHFYGAAYRALASKPIERSLRVPGVRGRILARDGTVLAFDREIVSLSVEYRYLEQPADPRWLEKLARRRLPRDERRRRQRVAAEMDRVLADRDLMHRRLAELCGWPLDELRLRAAAIQRRVTQISERVNDRRQQRLRSEYRDPLPADDGRSWLRSLDDILFPPAGAAPPPVTVVEELDHHIVFQDVALEVVAQVESHPELYPGVRIVAQRRRTYPAGALAAHVLGHVGPAEDDDLSAEVDDDRRTDPFDYSPDDTVGRTGAERRFEPILRAAAGIENEPTDRSGQPLETRSVRSPGAGRDLVLTIDTAAQHTAESLLDAALVRRRPARHASGGAIVLIDVNDGAILAAASAPRFDPNAFSGDSRAVAALLSAPGNALFDRVTRMALCPGSVFKIPTAAALLESGLLDADQPLTCRGYLHQPGAQRCQIFIRFGMGHGEVTLVDALARSCNVFFFHHAGQLGPEPLVEWGARFGFGRPTGVDLPHEAAGNLPGYDTAGEARPAAWPVRETQALAIGQGELTATPLQVARMMAAIANGGRLVTPHIAARLGLPESADDAHHDDRLESLLDVAEPSPIEGLGRHTLSVLRDGLRQVVASPDGTGHPTVFLDSVAIAGKTGTAQTGTGEDHAWFAGYAPAEAPRVAFVVVLEHAGNGAEVAGPVARRLVMRLDELGYLR